jgi:membrane-associated protease RseP (regulator of RpoE activity)
MGYRVGSAIIFSLMALAIFNDFTRLWMVPHRLW